MKEPSLSRRKRPSNGIISAKKFKLLCSFNGVFRRRSSDGKLRYVGGETRIVSVDPNVNFFSLKSMISELFKPGNPDFSLKYQLPGSDVDAPIVLITSDDDVQRMFEEYAKVELYGKPSRLWVFVCDNNGSNNDYFAYDDDPFVNFTKRCAFDSGLGFWGRDMVLKGEKSVGCVKGSEGLLCDPQKKKKELGVCDEIGDLNCGVGLLGKVVGVKGENLVGCVKGSNGYKNLIKSGVNWRRVSDNSLRKLVLKQQLFGQIQNRSLEKHNHDRPLIDLGPQTWDRSAANDVNASMIGCRRGLRFTTQLPSDQNVGGHIIPSLASHPFPLNPGDDNLLEETNQTESLLGSCGQGMDICSVTKQELVFSQRVSSQYLNRENIMPSSLALNSQLSCGNQSACMPKSFHRGYGVLGHCGIHNHQFSLNDLKNQRNSCACHNVTHHVVSFDGKPSAARCYAGLGANTTISKAIRLNHQNSPRPSSGPLECKAVEMKRFINPKWNDQASAYSLPLKNGNIKNETNVNGGGIWSPEAMEDFILIDFGNENTRVYSKVPSLNYSVTTIKHKTKCNDINMNSLHMVTRDDEEVFGTTNNAANSDRMLVLVKGGVELMGVYHTTHHLLPDGTASLMDLLSYKSLLSSSEIAPPAPSHVTSEISEVEGSSRTVLRSISDTAKWEKSCLLQEEILDNSHARPSIDNTVDTRESHKCSNIVDVIPGNLAAFYTHLATQELQMIKDSDLEYIKELGSRNYGTVYYGKWKGSDVAIKKIKARCFTDDAKEEDRLVSDFWKEAHNMPGQLHHPNIVAFYGIVTDGPIANLATVTEYQINGSLKRVLQRKERTIDCRKRLNIAMDAAFGMEYLHEKNTIHFDIKSHNLLVNMRDPQQPLCKLGDLGLSKIKQRTWVSGGVCGTIPWMAPELLSTGNNLMTEKVDVYSFGIVMWELFTGEEPYANMRSDEIIAGKIKGTLRPEIPSWCYPAWRSLMERCWSSDPKFRPSFSELAKELCAMSAAMNIK